MMLKIYIKVLDENYTGYLIIQSHYSRFHSIIKTVPLLKSFQHHDLPKIVES